MNWINGFELLCYTITVLFLIDIIRLDMPVNGPARGKPFDKILE